MSFFKQCIWLVKIKNRINNKIKRSWNSQFNNEYNQDSSLSQSIATSLVYKISELLLGWKIRRKRASLSTSFNYKGSITIEATIVLPLFLFFLMNLTSIFLIYHLYSQIDSYLYKNAKQLTILAYPLENGLEPSEGMSFAGEILTIAGLQLKINQEINSFGVLDGSISLLHSNLFEEDYVSLIATYDVSPLANMIPFTSFQIMNQCHMRCFTGYKYDNTSDTNSEEEYVYITEHGTVYHLTNTCTYIVIRTSAVTEGQLDVIRNDSGAIYYACLNCNNETSTTYHVTSYGTRYHTSTSCSSIERNVTRIPLSEVEGRLACSRCSS